MAPSPEELPQLTLLALQGSYHVNPINVLIHVICVPSIFATALVLAHYFPHPSLASLPVPAVLAPSLGPLVHVTPTFLVAAAYACYFVLLEPVAGVRLAGPRALERANPRHRRCIHLSSSR